MLTYEVETFNLTSGTRSLPSAPFFRMGTPFFTIGPTVVGSERAIERTEEEEWIELRDSLRRAKARLYLE